MMNLQADVLVVGAGSAGCCAAIAARMGGAKRVILAERYGFAGGTSTQMLDTFYGFFTPGEHPRKVVGGVPDIVVDRLHAAGAVFLRPNTYGAGTGVNYNPERLKLVWDELLAENGVEVYLHTLLCDLRTDSVGGLREAAFWTKGGQLRISAGRFIDATGDADLCHLAGASYEVAGELAPAQTLTTTFRLANVDLEAYEKAGGRKLLAEEMAQAVDSGAYGLPRKSGSLHRMNVGGCVATVAGRVSVDNPLDAKILSDAERIGRKQAFAYERFLRERIPGFAAANIIGLSHQIGIRETRRVYGEYRLTEQDCLRVARFEDRVLLCGAPLEDHREGRTGEAETRWDYIPGDGAYDVPYRTLIPAGRDDLWVVGRCFSATHEAHSSCRSMGQTMSMGAAAGFAAALSLAKNCSARQVPIFTLQEHLRGTGAVLETPSAGAHTGAPDWPKNRP